jgi:hypothetical protein
VRDISLVLERYTDKLEPHGAKVAELLGLPLAAMLPPNGFDIVRAMNSATTLFELAPDSPYVHGMRSLVDGLLGRQVTAAPGSRSAELWSRLRQLVKREWRMMFDSSSPIRLRQENDMQALKGRLHRHLIDAIDEDRADIDGWTPDQLKGYLEKQIANFIAEHKIAVNRSETQDLVASMIDELSGLGPIQPLVDDDEVNDILVNGRDRVFVERKGKLELTDIRFNDDRHVQRIIQRIIAPLGPAHRRVVSDGRRAPARRQPRQRGDPARRARRSGAVDPQVPQGAAARGRPAHLRHVRRPDPQGAGPRPCSRAATSSCRAARARARRRS